MNPNEKIILPDSPEAATYQPMAGGWVTSDFRLWGKGLGAEKAARYHGCTHVRCKRCGEPTPKEYPLCEACCDKAVKTEKENRRADLIRSAADAVRVHYALMNAALPGYEIGVPASTTADLGARIRGLKSLSSMRDKLDGAVANAKIAASQEADRRRLCIAVIDAHEEHRALIPDAATLVATKAPDDIRNLIAARITEHEARLRKQAEDAAERERVRRDEEAKAQVAADRAPPQEVTKGSEVEVVQGAAQSIATGLSAARERMADHLEASKTPCSWHLDEDEGSYDGTCGVKWVLLDGTPPENGMNFCPRCGGKLIFKES